MKKLLSFIFLSFIFSFLCFAGNRESLDSRAGGRKFCRDVIGRNGDGPDERMARSPRRHGRAEPEQGDREREPESASPTDLIRHLNPWGAAKVLFAQSNPDDLVGLSGIDDMQDLPYRTALKVYHRLQKMIQVRAAVREFKALSAGLHQLLRGYRQNQSLKEKIERFITAASQSLNLLGDIQPTSPIVFADSHFFLFGRRLEDPRNGFLINFLQQRGRHLEILPANIAQLTNVQSDQTLFDPFSSVISRILRRTLTETELSRIAQVRSVFASDQVHIRTREGLEPEDAHWFKAEMLAEALFVSQNSAFQTHYISHDRGLLRSLSRLAQTIPQPFVLNGVRFRVERHIISEAGRELMAHRIGIESPWRSKLIVIHPDALASDPDLRFLDNDTSR